MSATSPRTSKRPKRRPPPKRDNTPLILGVVALAIIFVGALVWININATSQPAAPLQVSAGKVWGKADAPVTIEEWSDFQ